MTNKNLVEIVAVVDRSSSMSRMRDEAISGFNTFLNEQKAQPGQADFTLVLFNHEYDLIFNGAGINFVKPLDLQSYVPAGTTALLDAVGRTIDIVGDRLAKTPEDKRPSKVIFCIITDGEENASGSYKLEKIRAMIEHQTNVYNWSFVYLAQGLDAFHGGHQIGLGDYTTQYAADGGGTLEAYKYATRTVSAMRQENDKPQ